MAKKYLLDHLAALCMDRPENMIFTFEEACRALDLAILFDAENVQRRSIRVIGLQFGQAKTSQMLMGLSLKAMEIIISSDYLLLDDETDVFFAIKR